MFILLENTDSYLAIDVTKYDMGLECILLSFIKSILFNVSVGV